MLNDMEKRLVESEGAYFESFWNMSVIMSILEDA